MAFVNSVLNWLIKKRIHQIELFNKYPVEVQTEVLKKLISSARDTEWGKKHKYKSIKTIEQFQNRVPVSEYDDLKPMIDRLRKGEQNIQAGKRRLQEEMGFKCELKELFSFVYKAPFDNGLTEHELDHVMIGRYNGDPVINPEEVESFKWMSLIDVKSDIAVNPQDYTAWFKIIFERFYTHLKL